jgi:CRP/FNR family cyclic AMP-dependent transcriptional regulator
MPAASRTAIRSSRPTPATERMLRGSRWAEVLPPNLLQRVIDGAIERRFEAGEWIARAGDRVEHWIGIVAGFAKMSVASVDGRVSTLTGVCAGVWFGEGSVIKHEPRRYDVMALRPSIAVLVPRADFLHLRDTSIAFNHYLQDLMNARLSLFIGTLAHDRLLDTDARVAYSIGSLFDEALYPQADRHVQIGQLEVGLLANVSRQRANVALQRLQGLGLLRIERSGLTILDVDGLHRFAEESHAKLVA